MNQGRRSLLKGLLAVPFGLSISCRIREKEIITQPEVTFTLPTGIEGMRFNFYKPRIREGFAFARLHEDLPRWLLDRNTKRN